MDQEGEDMESSVSDDTPEEEDGQIIIERPNINKGSSMVDKPTNTPTIISGAQGIKSTDASPAGKMFLIHKASNIDIRKPGPDDLSRDVRYNINMRQINSKNVSQRSLFFFHQSSNKLNYLGENDEFQNRPFGKFAKPNIISHILQQNFCN